MNRDSEKYLEKKLVREIKNLGGLALKFTSSTEAGYPDRLLILPGGVSLWVEIKSKGEKPTKLQKHRITTLKKLKQDVEIIDNYADLENLISQLKRTL